MLNHYCSTKFEEIQFIALTDYLIHIRSRKGLEICRSKSKVFCTRVSPAHFPSLWGDMNRPLPSTHTLNPESSRQTRQRDAQDAVRAPSQKSGASAARNSASPVDMVLTRTSRLLTSGLLAKELKVQLGASIRIPCKTLPLPSPEAPNWLLSSSLTIFRDAIV